MDVRSSNLLTLLLSANMQKDSNIHEAIKGLDRKKHDYGSAV